MPERDRLPIERLVEGLYIHPGSVTVVTITTRTPTVDGHDWKVEENLYVEALDFMLVQRERDEMRRTLALVNEALHRQGVHAAHARARELLRGAGFGVEEARAISGIIAWAHSEERR